MNKSYFVYYAADATLLSVGCFGLLFDFDITVSTVAFSSLLVTLGGKKRIPKRDYLIFIGFTFILFSCIALPQAVSEAILRVFRHPLFIVPVWGFLAWRLLQVWQNETKKDWIPQKLTDVQLRMFEIARQAVMSNESWGNRVLCEAYKQPNGSWIITVLQVPKTPEGVRKVTIDENGTVTDYS